MHGGAAEPGLLLRALSLPMPGADAGGSAKPKENRQDRQTDSRSREKTKLGGGVRAGARSTSGTDESVCGG